MNPEGDYRCPYPWQAAVKGASELLWMLRVHILSYPPLERTMGQLALLGFIGTCGNHLGISFFVYVRLCVCTHAPECVCMNVHVPMHEQEYTFCVKVKGQPQVSSQVLSTLLLFFSQVRISLMAWSVSVCSVSVCSVSVWSVSIWSVSIWL